VVAFETVDIAAMTGSQLDALLVASPMVLDLDGNGVQTRAAANGVFFDLTGTGNTDGRVGWVGDGDGLLVRDRNGDGVINNGTELYGVATQNEHGQRMGNAFAALGLEDTNHDGKVSAADEHYNELKVWVDANHDGRTDAGELHGLAELGVAELHLDRAAGDRIDEGNLVGLEGRWTGADGASHEMSDVWFAKEATGPDGSAPNLAELVAAPATELLPGAPSTAVAMGPDVASTAVPMNSHLHHRLGLDDDQHHNLLL
jgi:trimeric autotransporter adhesin